MNINIAHVSGLEKNGFYLENRILNYEGKSTVVFDDTLIQEGRKYIRPYVSNGTIQIWNSEKQVWVSGNDVWSNMPLIAKKVLIKVHGGTTGAMDVWFSIKDTVGFNEILTTKKNIWSYTNYESYNKTLTENIDFSKSPVDDVLAIVDQDNPQIFNEDEPEIYSRDIGFFESITTGKYRNFLFFIVGISIVGIVVQLSSKKSSSMLKLHNESITSLGSSNNSFFDRFVPFFPSRENSRSGRVG